MKTSAEDINRFFKIIAVFLLVFQSLLGQAQRSEVFKGCNFAHFKQGPGPFAGNDFILSVAHDFKSNTIDNLSLKYGVGYYNFSPGVELNYNIVENIPKSGFYFRYYTYNGYLNSNTGISLTTELKTLLSMTDFTSSEMSVSAGVIVYRFDKVGIELGGQYLFFSDKTDYDQFFGTVGVHVYFRTGHSKNRYRGAKYFIRKQKKKQKELEEKSR